MTSWLETGKALTFSYSVASPCPKPLHRTCTVHPSISLGQPFSACGVQAPLYYNFSPLFFSANTTVYPNCNLYSGRRNIYIFILFYLFDSEQQTKFCLRFSENPQIFPHLFTLSKFNIVCTSEYQGGLPVIFFESTVFPNTIRTSSFRRVTSHTSKFKLFYNVHVVAACA